MKIPVKEQVAGKLAELIQDAEYRRGMVKVSDNCRDVRKEWLDKAYKAIEEVQAFNVLPEESFSEFDNPNITGSLHEYEAGIAGDLAAADVTRKAFDSDIRCLRNVRTLLARS